MRQGTTRRGKPHCEAFPAINILEAERSLRSGSDRCEWRDEHAGLVGRGSLLSLDATSMTLDYTFIGSANIAAANGVLKVAVSGTRRNPHVVRKNLHCPVCERRVQLLYFVTGTWACRACHNLVYLKQRLGGVNKKILHKDKLFAELAKQKESGRAKRALHNQQRHVDRVSRELVQGGFTALPGELCYRTTCRWLNSGEMPVPVGARDASYAHSPYPRGLAYFRRPDDEASGIVPCELIGSLILDRPVQSFFEQHVQDTLAAVEQGIAKGSLLLPKPMAEALSAVVADRLLLRPLMLTGGWSDIDDRYTREDRAESTSFARYDGDPLLWKFSAAATAATRPLRAILDDHRVQLCARLPAEGRSDAPRDIKAAAATIETRLADVRTLVDAFNAGRSEIARRAVRQRRR